jgi:hypothetical protein
MIRAQTEGVFYVESNRDDKVISWTSARSITPNTDDLARVVDMPERGLRATGVHAGDLAVMLSILDEDAQEKTISYLVAYALDGAGLLIPGDVVEAKPKTWTTPYMRFMINELSEGEFEQFTLPNLTAFARQD